MKWLEPFEQGLVAIVEVSQLGLETLSVICVLAGVAAVARLVFSRDRPSYPYTSLRLRFGSWLALALEFQLGADVIATTVAPSLEELTKLAAIAVIRTYLNYYLGKEMKGEREADTAETPL